MTPECCLKLSDLDILTQEIKEKLKIKNNKEKVKLLIIMPVTWSIQQTANFFGVSTAMVKQARNLKQTNSILSEPKEKTGRPISDELKHAAKHFYESDKYSRMRPGKKEFVSVKSDDVKQHKQERLLLCN